MSSEKWQNPRLSLWRLELSLMQLCRKDLPLAEDGDEVGLPGIII